MFTKKLQNTVGFQGEEFRPALKAGEWLRMRVDSITGNTPFITPMKTWKTGLNSLSSGDTTSVTGTGQVPFQDVFQTAVDQVKTTQADVENKEYLLATGQLEDAHSLPIAEAKAAVSLDMLISLRNKALESYNDLLKMNI